MVDYREILRLKSLDYSQTDIAASVHSSRNTIQEVLVLPVLYRFNGHWMTMSQIAYWNLFFIRTDIKRMKNA